MSHLGLTPTSGIKEAGDLKERTMKAWDAVLSEFSIKCPKCGVVSPAWDFEAGICPSCRHEMDRDEMVEILEGQGLAINNLTRTQSKLRESRKTNQRAYDLAEAKPKGARRP